MDCSHLYLIADKQRRYVKVGVSAAPEQRLRQLNSGQAPFPLVLIQSWALENAYDCEKYLHERLAPYHYHGEWFRYAAAAKVSEWISESFSETKTPRAKCADARCPAMASPCGTGFCSYHDFCRTRIGESPI